MIGAFRFHPKRCLVRQMSSSSSAQRLKYVHVRELDDVKLYERKSNDKDMTYERAVGKKHFNKERTLNRGARYHEIEETIEKLIGKHKEPYKFEDGKDIHKLRFEEERLASVYDKEKLMAEAFRDDPGSLDLSDIAVVTKTLGISDSNTLYDFGVGTTFKTPKPLHTGIGNNGTNLSVTKNQMKYHLERMQDVQYDENQRRAPFDEEIVLKIKPSKFLVTKGQELPDFSHASGTTEGDEDPVEMSWKMIEFSKQNRRPIRCRVLKRNPAGFNVALGAVPAFLPFSHIFPRHLAHSERDRGSKYSPGSNHIDPDDLVGEQIYVMILSSTRQVKNVVVSHKMVPTMYSFKSHAYRRK